MVDQIYKYPRTQHIEGSGLQIGDEDLDVVPFDRLVSCHLVVEEKMDGANCAISFSASGSLLLQSRGHYLAGGARERQFDLFKTWAHRYTAELWDILEDRYIMFGEWLYAKHTIFYTELPHYFLEFDIYDRREDSFLSTERRAKLLEQAPFVSSVKVLHVGFIPSVLALTALIGPSHFIAPNHMGQMAALCLERGLDPAQTLRETDSSGLMEGLYIKVEQGGVVEQRYKYIRAGFLQAVFVSQSHWIDRPLLPNGLRSGVSLF
jgi:RNA ligase